MYWFLYHTPILPVTLVLLFGLIFASFKLLVYVRRTCFPVTENQFPETELTGQF